VAAISVAALSRILPFSGFSFQNARCHLIAYLQSMPHRPSKIKYYNLGTRIPPIRLQACLFKYRTRVISSPNPSSPHLRAPPSFPLANLLAHKPIISRGVPVQPQALASTQSYCALSYRLLWHLYIWRSSESHPGSSDPRLKYHRIFLRPLFNFVLNS
jgi:hypothetical protein